MEPRPASAWRRWGRLIVTVLAVILVPFFLLAPTLEGWSGELLQWRPTPAVAFGVVVVLLLSDILLPIPSSVVLVYSGMALGLVGGALANWLGLTLSLLFGYGLGRLAARGAIRRVLDDGPRAELEEAFRRWGPWVLAATRPVPVLAEAAAFLAGVAGWPRGQVVLWGGLANLGLALVMSAAGAVSAHYGETAWAWLAAVAFPALAWLGWRWLAKRRGKGTAG